MGRGTSVLFDVFDAFDILDVISSIAQMWKIIVLLGFGVGLFIPSVQGQGRDTLTRLPLHRFEHGIGVEVRPEYIFPTNPFLQGDNPERKLIRGAFSAHFKYSFRYRPGSLADRVYGGVYQGVGIGRYSFGEPTQMGNPWAFYLFQGARIARICPWLSFNYEWNFGLSTGWQPYDSRFNPYNKMIGSKMNAYINTNFYLRWMVTPRLGVTTGITLTHFSNGNTNFPNAGLNTIGARIGVDYNFARREDLSAIAAADRQPVPAFRRHMSYDFVVFGSWRRKGVDYQEGQILAPENYPVFGFNFAPMYNLGYKLRLGVSLDGVYDGSANIAVDKDHYIGDEVGRSDIVRPDLRDQFALGLSGRVEYVMPYFTVGIGMGTNFIGKGDLKTFYQVLALKVALSKDAFLHVGYNLQKFRTPSFLMLGVGFRFNSSARVRW